MVINHNEILWQIIDKGIIIGGKKYKLFTATTGQVRNCKVTDEDNKKNKFDYKNLMNNSYVLDYKGVKQPLYEPDRYSDEYIKAYAVWNNRKKAKQKLCQDIKKEMDRRNTDSRDITAKFEVFHYHCIREIKDIFTKNGEFNINLAVNSIIDIHDLRILYLIQQLHGSSVIMPFLIQCLLFHPK